MAFGPVACASQPGNASVLCGEVLWARHWVGCTSNARQVRAIAQVGEVRAQCGGQVRSKGQG